MTRTVTIEVPDKLLPDLDRVLARWAKVGKPAEVTLMHMLRHGIEMMDIGERVEGEPPPDGWPDDLKDDIPF